MNKPFLFIAALFLLLSPQTSWAMDEAVMVDKALTGDSFLLKDGREVRLGGLKAPEQSREMLEKIIVGKEVLLEGATIDRYGRTVAEVFVIAGKNEKISVQHEAVKAGAAFIYSLSGSEPDLEELAKLENEARAARRGIWRDPFYADVPADRVEDKVGRFAFVRGLVLDAARVKNKVYLNFGSDWRTDFTVEIAARDLRKFKKAQIDPLELKGKTIHVRGLVQNYFGPIITVTHPAQIGIEGQAR